MKLKFIIGLLFLASELSLSMAITDKERTETAYSKELESIADRAACTQDYVLNNLLRGDTVFISPAAASSGLQKLLSRQPASDLEKAAVFILLPVFNPEASEIGCAEMPNCVVDGLAIQAVCALGPRAAVSDQSNTQKMKSDFNLQGRENTLNVQSKSGNNGGSNNGNNEGSNNGDNGGSNNGKELAVKSILLFFLILLV
uniref:FAS1 domain-containing protein n=1 Tax=Caenorhabditis tropicalis TaxID=1561998 RepID=A0A1I7SXU0_9PELO